MQILFALLFALIMVVLGLAIYGVLSILDEFKGRGKVQVINEHRLGTTAVPNCIIYRVDKVLMCSVYVVESGKWIKGLDTQDLIFEYLAHNDAIPLGQDEEYRYCLVPIQPPKAK